MINQLEKSFFFLEINRWSYIVLLLKLSFIQCFYLFIDLDVFCKYFLNFYYSDKKVINFKLIYDIYYLLMQFFL